MAAARQARTEGDMEKARFGEFAKLYLNLTNRDVELPKTLEDIRDIYDKIALDELDDVQQVYCSAELDLPDEE